MIVIREHAHILTHSPHGHTDLKKKRRSLSSKKGHNSVRSHRTSSTKFSKSTPVTPRRRRKKKTRESHRTPTKSRSDRSHRNRVKSRRSTPQDKLYKSSSTPNSPKRLSSQRKHLDEAPRGEGSPETKRSSLPDSVVTQKGSSHASSGSSLRVRTKRSKSAHASSKRSSSLLPRAMSRGKRRSPNPNRADTKPRYGAYHPRMSLRFVLILEFPSLISQSFD